MVAAGVAISLQDIFKNFAGGITIFLTGLFHVGDRIEIDSKSGDVIDINIFYTTILEIREWIKGDQATGRISMIPNGTVLSNVVNNYTKDHGFLWDEISIPITYDSDWKEVPKILKEIALKETDNNIDKAKRSISRLGERYYLSDRVVEPIVFMDCTDNWINFTLRYVVEVRGKRLLRSKFTHLILEAIEQNPNINIASSTIAITKVPDIKIKK